jgi:DNA topoisomerase-1
MGKSLVIVESPSKAKTIGKYLGQDYKVLASVGHIIDLPRQQLGIDVKNDFKPTYIPMAGTAEVRKKILTEAARADRVFLATDPDREGEAISWHISNMLKLDESKKNRIEFNEITKPAIREAMEKPRSLDQKLIDAQQARRILDRLVGYKISPILGKKIRRGLSAGRTQSAGLKIIIEREREIQAFKPEEYWVITAEFVKDGQKFTATLAKFKGKKLTVGSKEETDEVLTAIKNGDFTVSKALKKDKQRRPFAPFVTSTLQRDALTRLGFSASRTMGVAQKLYESGYITYMRTDSVRISKEADSAVRKFIEQTYSKNYLGDGIFTNKKKEIQDAHEAIRPSDVSVSPGSLSALPPEQQKLYNLIWSRFVASRMRPAVLDTVSAEIENSGYIFAANGQTLKFDGFLKVYGTMSEETILPELTEGETLAAEKINSEQKFTKPPARYSEGSFIKTLEELGIGRPSTYAAIIATLLKRTYIEKIEKSLVPTKLGFVINDIMEKNFMDIVDTKFTAELEEKLDDIEVGKGDWVDIIGKFYFGGFEKELEAAQENIAKIESEDEKTDEVCEKCGKPMIIKQGRYGKFLACSGYPKCKNAKPILEPTGIKCPKCGRDIVKRRTKTGRTFYGCSGYPDCDQTYWKKPKPAAAAKEAAQETAAEKNV